MSQENKCLKIALSGGMGCGKSAAARAFSECGIEVVDADKLCHIALENSIEVKTAVKELLGRDCYDSTDKPDRKAIAQKVFKDAEMLSRLETILHPAIEKLWTAKAENVQSISSAAGKRAILVVEVPLLFEKKLENRFDICISVYCSNALRKKRLIERGMTDSEIRERDAYQMSPTLKASLANIVLFNESSFDFLKRQVEIVLSRL